MKEYTISGSQVDGFKSKLEEVASRFLTQGLGLTAYYEPETFKVGNRLYTPDFYCPEINTYFECKPGMEFAFVPLYQTFAEEQHCDLVILTPKGIGMIENATKFGMDYITELDQEEIRITKCPECGKVSLYTDQGSWHCRACNFAGKEFYNAPTRKISFPSFYRVHYKGVVK